MGPGGYGGRSVFAEIEAGNGNGLLRLPVPNAEFSFLVLIEFGAGGDQAKLARPAQEEVIGRKFPAISQVRVPAFSGTDEQHAVSCVLDDIAPVMKMKSEFQVARGSLRKNDIQIIVAARAAFLEVHALILKKSEDFTLLAGDAVYRQSPGKLESENAFRSGFRAQTDCGGGIQRVLGGDRSLEGVVQCAKGCRKNGRVRNSMRGPDIVKRFAVDCVKLSEEELLVTLLVKHDIERAGGRSFEPGVKAALGTGRKPIKKNAQGVTGIELSHGGIPLRADG